MVVAGRYAVARWAASRNAGHPIGSTTCTLGRRPLRPAYSEILADERWAQPAPRSCNEPSTTTLPAASPASERLMTDIAWAYRYSLRDLCDAAAITQVFIRSHCPWQNGKVERRTHTLLTAWAYRQVFLAQLRGLSRAYPSLEHYNARRRHSALGGSHPSAGCCQPDVSVQQGGGRGCRGGRAG